MGKVAEMTHDEIAEWAAGRLRRMGYPLAFANMTSAIHGEQPDVLAIDSFASPVLVEVKVSRADFLADKKKPWRQPGEGIGKRRIYLAPPGILKLEDIPYGWEFWEIHGKNRPVLKVIKGRDKVIEKDSSFSRTKHVLVNTTSEEMVYFRDQHDGEYKKEATWMIKILKRISESGFEVERFANGKG